MDFTCSLVERLNIVQMSVLPNLIYRFNTIQITISASYFMDTGKLTLKFKWKVEKNQNSQPSTKEQH